MNSASTKISAAQRELFETSGSKSVRLSKDSQHKFDQCNICLHALLEPISCQKGHLYCKKCIYGSLLEQKKDSKKKLKKWEESNRERLAEKLKEERRLAQTKIEEFERQESSLVTKKGESSESILVTTNSWWLPNEAPSADSQKADGNSNPLQKQDSDGKPSTDTFCPRDGHTLKTKHLIEVNFTLKSKSEHRKDTEDIQAEYNQFICPLCFKDLQAVSKVIMVKSCGHAFCSKCCSEFVKTHCPNCEKPCDGPGELITLQSGASGFASGGASIVKKYGPGARVM